MTPDPSPDAIRAATALWLIRRDRGLSSAESIEYELWLAADERHAAALNRSTRVWSLLDGIPAPTAAPVLAAVTRRRSFWRQTRVFGGLAAAAVLFFGLMVWRSPLAPSAPDTPLQDPTPAGPRTVTLTDGSLVQLNTGGEILEQFTAAERRVMLVRGEAHFSVTKNPARPFVVQTGTLLVRAIGTAFNVNRAPLGVDVLVTEGRVQLIDSRAPAPGSSSAPAAALPSLSAGDRAVFRGEPEQPRDLAQALIVSHADTTEITRTLSWREPLLRLGGASLAELAAQFERGTGRRLVLADPALAELRFGGRFRADDIEGFTHLLGTTLDLDVEHAADGTIVLRKKKPDSR
ncbi:MAG: FecR domain-containing protein [Undibacterium sp.]|nr:FecR domain-containing protein [Opitutaceae bacterium]